MPNGKRRRARRIRIQPPALAPCPTPDKQRYIDEPDAARAAAAYSRKVIAERRHFAPLYGYLCPCGGWHMTRRPRWDGVDHVLLYAIADHLQEFALAAPDPSALAEVDPH